MAIAIRIVNADERVLGYHSVSAVPRIGECWKYTKRGVTTEGTVLNVVYETVDDGIVNPTTSITIVTEE